MNNLRNVIQNQFNLFDNNIALLEQVVKDYPASSLTRLLLTKKYDDSGNVDATGFRKESAIFMGNVPWYLFVLSRGAETDHNNTAQTVVAAISESTDEINEPEEETLAELRDVATGESGLISTEEPSLAESIRPIEQTVSALIRDAPEEDDNGIPVLRVNVALPEETHEPKEDVSEDEDDTSELQQEGDTPEIEGLQGEEQPEESQQESASTDSELPPSTNADTAEKEKLNVNFPVLEKTEEPLGELQIEPLFRTDWFAYKGVKLEERDLTNDPLSNQVRSFTAWLRSMKRVHPGKTPEQNQAIEKIVQHVANKSNVDPQVPTETMAEVLVKQNKKDSAIELYEKLSLMNPSKSAYFAAKIENLKTN